jgi:putative ABC transport system permease protein
VFDLVLLSLRNLLALRLRSALSILGIAIGFGSVILLTSVGEGTRRYILDQFSQFGTNLMSVSPGKTETSGLPSVFGGTTRPLTIDDGEELKRIPGVTQVVAAAIGTAPVKGGPLDRSRNVAIWGVTPAIEEVWKFRVRQGSFWRATDPRRGSAECVRGQKLARELFGAESPLGAFVRVDEGRFRVVGVMEGKGSMLGMDVDDVAYVPVASAMRLFNLQDLHELHVTYANADLAQRVENEVRAALTRRHGSEDFTVTTQAAMLEVFGNVMDVVTMSVGAIAGISLLVGAIGILTMMWIAVGERTHEIGLVRAFGGSRRQVRAVFLAEAAGLGAVGGLAGLAGATALGALLRAAVPGLPLYPPAPYIAAAVGVAFLTGLVAGVLPARRAAMLDPIEALRAE